MSCERLIDSRLNNLPIIIGGTTDRGVVASCSYEARLFGIHSAMPIKMAKERCPEAIIIRGNADHYTKFSGMSPISLKKHHRPMKNRLSMSSTWIFRLWINISVV